MVLVPITKGSSILPLVTPTAQQEGPFMILLVEKVASTITKTIIGKDTSNYNYANYRTHHTTKLFCHKFATNVLLRKSNIFPGVNAPPTEIQLTQHNGQLEA